MAGTFEVWLTGTRAKACLAHLNSGMKAKKSAKEGDKHEKALTYSVTQYNSKQNCNSARHFYVRLLIIP
jgi:hypothetical protein